MPEKSDRWKSREWYGTTKTRWQQTAGSRRLEHAKPKGKWKEVSAEYEALNALVKEKRITWNKSGNDLYTMLESAASDEKKEERDRDKLGDNLKAFLKRKEEEDEATCLMEEMRKNVEAAQHKVLRRSKVCAALFGIRRYVRQRSGSPEDNDDKTLAIDAKPGN